MLQAVANNSMSKMGGLSSIRPPRLDLIVSLFGCTGEESLAHPQKPKATRKSKRHRKVLDLGRASSSTSAVGL